MSQPGTPDPYDPPYQPYPQGAYQQGGYPQAPGGAYAPIPGGGAVPPVPKKPATVVAAFTIWLLAAAASLVVLIVVITSPIWDQALAEAQRQGTDLRGTDPQQLIAVLKGVFIGVFAVLAGLFLLFDFKMLAGRNWARIVLTVLGVLSAISAFSPTTSRVYVGDVTYTYTNAPNIVLGVLSALGIILMYVGGANEYFAAIKRRKAAQTLYGR